MRDSDHLIVRTAAMIRHRFALALAAIALSMFLAEAANALPLSTKTGTTSLTGAWSPLDWTTSVLEDSTTGLKTFDVTGTPEFLLDYEASGTFEASAGSGYPASGAITVRYTFGTGEFCVITEWDSGNNTLSVRATDLLNPIGKVSVLGFEPDKDVMLPPGDTPVVGDTFFLFATSLIDPVLSITVDNPSEPEKFTAMFPQPFEHLGPFAYSKRKGDKNLLLTLLPSLLSTHEEDKCDEDEDECHSKPGDDECDEDEDKCRFKWKDWVLDTDRLNPDCGNETVGFSPCGGARFSSINVPEPGTLALFGLGLAGLAVRRRPRSRQ